MVVGKDINRMKEFFHKIFALKLRILSFQFFFWLKSVKFESAAFSTMLKLVKIPCFLFASFERDSTVCALARLSKIQNVWFTPVIEFTLAMRFKKRGLENTRHLRKPSHPQS